MASHTTKSLMPARSKGRKNPTINWCNLVQGLFVYLIEWLFPGEETDNNQESIQPYNHQFQAEKKTFNQNHKQKSADKSGGRKARDSHKSHDQEPRT